MKTIKTHGSRGRVDAGAYSPSNRTSVLQTVRSLAGIAGVLHEVAMRTLLAGDEDEQRFAEQFNDAFHPIVDLLFHFEVKEDRDGNETREI